MAQPVEPSLLNTAIPLPLIFVYDDGFDEMKMRPRLTHLESSFKKFLSPLIFSLFHPFITKDLSFYHQ